jgi:hypothetical protein
MRYEIFSPQLIVQNRDKDYFKKIINKAIGGAHISPIINDEKEENKQQEEQEQNVGAQGI